MVSATIKPKEDLVHVHTPKAETLTKVDKAELIRSINIGIPKNHVYGSEPKISVESKFIEVSDVSQWALSQKESLPESYQDQMIIVIKADEKANMGIISDVQQALRKVNARKIVYRTLEDD